MRGIWKTAAGFGLMKALGIDLDSVFIVLAIAVGAIFTIVELVVVSKYLYGRAKKAWLRISKK